MPSLFISVLTDELTKLNGHLSPTTVADAVAKAVTATLAGNEAKVILRRVVEPTETLALTELELSDDFLHLYPEEVAALRSMLLVWDEDGQPKPGDLLLVSQRTADGSVITHYWPDHNALQQK